MTTHEKFTADMEAAGFEVECLLTTPRYQPGDATPKGYMHWHEWAKVQHRGGLRQAKCRVCQLWLFPQEVNSHKCQPTRRRVTLLQRVGRAWWKVLKSPTEFERLQDALDDEADEVEYDR
jgi:hypothetical protein